jgi:taurine dioxygenase
MITVRKADAVCGAEVLGVDLSQPLDEATFRNIEQIWHEHEVIVFRNQNLTPARHVEFSRQFGELECHVRTDVCRPGHPEILVVSNVFENGKPIGSQDAGLFWHSDLCYKAEPSRGSLLYAREVPIENGKALGPTRFSSMTAAYNALPRATREKLDDLRVVNSYLKAYRRERESERKPLTEEQKKRVPDVVHPAVRLHPYTGKKCVFMNEGYTTKLLGIDEGESDALLGEVLNHITQPAFVYTHDWQVGDLVIWDNCSTQHCATADYKLPLRRIMDRTTLRGTPTS